MNELYGAFLRLTGRHCVVIGGGPVAERKCQSLLAAGALVTVIAPNATETLVKMAEVGTLRWKPRTYRADDVQDAFLLIAATDSREVNRLVHEDAERAGKLVNVVNDQTLGNFIVPAMIHRGRLQIGVSTSGASPLIAKRIRQQLEEVFGEEYEMYLDWLADIRKELLLTQGEEKQRTELLRKIADSEVLDMLREGRADEAKRLIAAIMGGQNE